MILSSTPHILNQSLIQVLHIMYTYIIIPPSLTQIYLKVLQPYIHQSSPPFLICHFHFILTLHLALRNQHIVSKATPPPSVSCILRPFPIMTYSHPSIRMSSLSFFSSLSAVICLSSSSSRLHAAHLPCPHPLSQLVSHLLVSILVEMDAVSAEEPVLVQDPNLLLYILDLGTSHYDALHPKQVTPAPNSSGPSHSGP
ncbi:hypothetical protein E2C01_031206 [Portunus trituberculatus]|uniref:Uncharacterized protein n=1 Tax=Portunus trituberculatus TaxID=210409 RepID=A0A5B7EX07_PORTR|nr:hypothetical protein [Portunus trituberculatus]